VLYGFQSKNRYNARHLHGDEKPAAASRPMWYLCTWGSAQSTMISQLQTLIRPVPSLRLARLAACKSYPHQRSISFFGEMWWLIESTHGCRQAISSSNPASWQPLVDCSVPLCGLSSEGRPKSKYTVQKKD
jgi:hypothetical protein